MELTSYLMERHIPHNNIIKTATALKGLPAAAGAYARSNAYLQSHSGHCSRIKTLLKDHCINNRKGTCSIISMGGLKE
jgi:hypothetical protein